MHVPEFTFPKQSCSAVEAKVPLARSGTHAPVDSSRTLILRLSTPLTGSAHRLSAGTRWPWENTGALREVRNCGLGVFAKCFAALARAR